MPNLATKDQISAGLLIAASSALVTYSITKKLTETKREQIERERRLETLKKRDVLKKKAETSSSKDSKAAVNSGTKLPDTSIEDIYLWEVEHLGDYFESEAKHIANAMHGMKTIGGPSPSSFSGVDENIKKRTEYNKLIGIHECILADLVRKPGQKPSCKAYVRAGPRATLHFDPKKVNAAIVTCGGLCPGLNNVVREITNTLFHLYDIKGKVWGICGGYKGFHDPATPPVELTPEFVENIHHHGGTVLGSSRGGFDLDKILAFIKKFKISQLYVIGGDGTHRGAFMVHEECMAKVGLQSRQGHLNRIKNISTSNWSILTTFSSKIYLGPQCISRRHTQNY